MTEEQVFLAALDLPDATARAAYLDEHCGANAGFRGQVEALLASHFKSGEFMDVPAPEQIDVEPSFNHAVTILSEAMPAKVDPEVDSEGLQFLEPSSRPDSLGRIGHYEVLQVLGVGGFGIVLRAFDDVLQRVVAVKVMAPQLATTSPARKRFLREARTSAQVRHDNVVQVYEVGEQPLPYRVMEFIPGETLQQRLDRIGPLEVTEVLRIGRQIAEGLAAAHATDLIHRDIKPGNVLLEGGHLKVKITDFGLARAADDASMTQSGMIAGTPMYMAPEQVLGDTLDQRADLFSLGTVMYQMVSGRVPFRAPSSIAVLKRVAEDTPRNIREVIPETPQWLCDIISKLHAKKPDERYQSAREIADVLANCEEQLKANSKLKDYSRIPRAKSASSGKWKWAAVAAAVLLPIVALAITEFAGVTNWFRGRQPKVAVAPISTVNLGPTAADRVNPQTDPKSDGFVALFNGQDLTGWKFHPDQLGHWEVKDGILKGSKRQSHLFSERGDYSNFHLRAEVKINLGGDSGILFRAPLELRRGRTPVEFGVAGCYEAELQQNRIHARPTGSISESPGDAPPNILCRVVDGSLTEPDEWFTYEVIAENNHFITKINGSEVANCSDPQVRHQTGHLALQVWQSNTLVQFRKIEIKELPATPPVTDGFVALFNGKDLTGWKKHSLSGGEWSVEDGAIDGRGTTSYLFSESGEYDNFHLRVEAKVNGNGDAGVCFRTPFDVKGLPNTSAAKFALLGGYEAAIALKASYPTHTGSLTAADGPTLQAGPLLPHQADEWFVLEVIAEDNRIRTLVDGKPTADYIDEERRFSRGHIALQTWGPNITNVQFRRVEIKELPASKPPATTSPNVAVVEGLRALAVEKESFRNQIKQEHLAGKMSALDVIYAEIDLSEARIHLSHAEGNSVAHIAQYRRLVSLREQESEAIAQQVKGGQLKADEQERADSSLVDARGRLAKALAEAPADAIAAAADQQVEEVRKELVRLNPGFDGKLTPTIENGVITQLSINTDEVLDISPVRALAGLIYLDCRGTYPNKGKLSDLSPLKGMKLSRIDCSSTQIADLTPLTGLPLTYLHFNHNPVADLTPLQGMPLLELGLAETKVSDLSPLKGMKLRILGAQLLSVTDLTPLAGMPLKGLDLYHTIGVTNLEPLKGMPLEGLNLQDVPVSDLSPLAGMTTLRTLLLQGNAVSDLTPLQGLKLTTLILRDKQISDLSPLKGMPLARFEIYGTGVSDLRPLQGMPLEEIRLTPMSITQGLEVVRDIKSLKTIGIDGKQAWPAAEFWERYDKREFK